MKKIISITLAVTTIIWLSGVAMLAPVSAITIVEGDVVSPDATYTDADGNTYYPYDVFIIKYVGTKKFKRLVLNPQVFDSYGHLKWSNIKTATVAELQAFTTSELVRADGDDKVYKLIPDGDTGSKKWVETLDCFTTNSYDWDSVYIINSTDRDNYTTGAGMCGGDGGDITLSLATDTPVAASIPYNAEGVPHLKFNVTGTGTISQIVVKRTGVGEAADFDNVYLYEGENRLTSGRSISTSTNKVAFIGLSIKAPTTITVVGDLVGSSADDGHINAFSIESASDVTSSATVGGTFPIKGNLIAITSIQGGKLTIIDTGSLSNPNVGQKEALVTQFRITADYEAINLSRVTLYNGGSMNSIEITNLKMKDAAGTTVATSTGFGSDDLATFVFSTPYKMEKGTQKTFKVYGDLAGDKDDTIYIYVEVSADIKGIGASFGHGSEVDATGFDGGSGEYHSLTLEGGELTIAFNGPIATDISDDTNDTVMLDLSFTAASDLEIKKLRAYLCFYEEGTLHNINALTEHVDEVEDIKVKDKDTGTILMGPTDGSSFTLESATSVCDSTANYGVYREWTDAWDLDTGQTKNLQITADIDVDADTDAADAWKAVLYGYSNLTNPVKYRGTNDYVASADIVPSTDIAGNKMTIQTSSISVALGSVPTSYVDAAKAQAGIKAMSLLFTAGDASEMNLTSLVLTGYVGDVSGTYTIGLSSGGPYAKEVVTNVSIYESDGTTKISGPKSFSGGTNDSDVTFDNLSWKIPAGATKEMLVKVDITTTTTSSTYDYVAFDITDTTDVTATDDEGNSRNSSTEDINGTVGSSPTVLVRKSDGGTLTVAAAVAGIRPEPTYIYMGQQDAAFSKYKFTSTIEAFKIDKLTIEIDESADRIDLTRVELSYPIDAAGTLVSTKPSSPFGGTASITFDLTGKEMYVPKDDYAYLTVYGDLATYIDIGNQSADNWSLDFEGDGTTTFHATGVGSSKVIDASADTIADADGQTMYLYRTFPTFTMNGPAGTGATVMATRILEFTVTNNGDYDLVFNSTSGLFKFDVLGSGQVTSNATLTLYKWDGTSVDTATVTTPGLGTASCSFDFTDTTITIPKTGTQKFYVEIASGRTIWDENGDWLQMKLQDEANVVKWVDGSAIVQVGLTAGLKNLGIPMNGPTFSISGL